MALVADLGILAEWLHLMWHFDSKAFVQPYEGYCVNNLVSLGTAV